MFTLTLHADGGLISSSITLPLVVFAAVILGTILIAGCIGYAVGKHCNNSRSRDGAHDMKIIPLKSDRHEEPDKDCKLPIIGNGNERSDIEDGPTIVLRGSLDLMASKWGEQAKYDNDTASSTVVEYLSPEEMTKLLFTKVNEAGDNVAETLCLDEYRHETNDILSGDDIPSPKSSATDIVSLLNSSQTKSSQEIATTLTPPQFLKLLSYIQKYSVNTSHPYFFNQLFGSLDPIALAAEIVALSVNTSVYTYETAPVFTLMEREVMGQIGKLVFEQGNSIDCGKCEDKFEGEGLMIPGGSLANLTAMHAARHRWKVMNGYTRQQSATEDVEENWASDDNSEEKKSEDISIHETSQEEQQGSHLLYDYNKSTPDLVAFVSSEAHYSFSKSARVLGLREDDLIVIPTHSDGRMDVQELSKKIEELELQTVNHQGGTRKRVPFFVACTAGSTVRGSFDEVAEIVKVCRAYESRGSAAAAYERSIWVHVDGAWGGSAIFSSRPSLRSSTHIDEIRLADSFTFNPHKMLGAPQQTTAFIVRHRNALRNASAAGAKYLFDPRKNGAEYDLGDLSYTCGRRTDAVKLWALWKYYGKSGLGQRVDQKVDELELFVEEIKRRESFALACKPWPFNVNFFYFPPRIRRVLEERGITTHSSTWSHNMDKTDEEDFIYVPDDIAEDLANVSVMLKLRLHEAGEMIIPYQVRHVCGLLSAFIDI